MDHYLNTLEIADLESGEDTMYFLDQEEVVRHFFQKWAGQEDKIMVNDRLYIVELMAMECNQDRTTIFLNRYTKDSETLDNPKYKPIVYYAHLTAQFNQCIITFRPPDNVKKILVGRG
mmetsp:Transcript_6874/g.14827  ORF Transcript_6874/g.14827 Transcript_6874/m.14827 type:complete len:118 (+) Transcript_6874:250-603(+)